MRKQHADLPAFGHLTNGYRRIGRRHFLAVDDVRDRKRPVVCRADRPDKTHESQRGRRDDGSAHSKLCHEFPLYFLTTFVPFGSGLHSCKHYRKGGTLSFQVTNWGASYLRYELTDREWAAIKLMLRKTP